MTANIDTGTPLEVEGVPVHRYEVKRLAVERLLEWGFAPSAVAQMLGCSWQWVTEIRDEGLPHRP